MHDKCSLCSILDRCSGFFSTSAIQSSKYIQPILSELNYDEELTYGKPVNQKPSMMLKKYAKELIVNLDMPILDVACGYGRNGAFNKNLITTLQIDLMKDDWPFEENSFLL